MHRRHAGLSPSSRQIPPASLNAALHSLQQVLLDGVSRSKIQQVLVLSMD